MDESEGTAKGSIKDRVRVLNILLKIAKKKKLKLLNVNSDTLENINKMYMFFYTPVRLSLSDRLGTDNMVLYAGLNESEKSLVKESKEAEDVEITIITRKRKKKGINYIEELKKHKEELNINEELDKKIDELRKSVGYISDSEAAKIKEEIAKKYNVNESNISISLIRDYLAIKTRSVELFDAEISDSLKEALIKDRIKAERDLQSIKKATEEIYFEELLSGELSDETLKIIEALEKEEKGDIYLEKDIDYDIKVDIKALEKLTKLLEQQQKEIERISKQVDRYTIMTNRRTHFTNVGSLISGSIGIGLGLLTLPFSFSRTFALGTNLIRNSVNSIRRRTRLETEVTRTREYTVTMKDIDTFANSIKTADFLLDSTLKDLDSLKYKIKLYEYKIPNAAEKLSEIEILEKGLAKRKAELTKVAESFEKNKVKVLNRAA